MSYAVEPSVARPRLISPVGLFVVAATVAASLALLFPGLDFGHPKFLAHPDELSIAYLKQVLQQRPQDRSARLLLARQQIALGKWEAAEANLRQLAEGDGRDPITWRARLARLELGRATVEALPPGTPARLARQGEVLAELRALAGGPFEAADLARMAELALALEGPGEAASIYTRLARDAWRVNDAAHGTSARAWARLAGRWYQAAGRLNDSAEAYLTASVAAGPQEDGAGDAATAIDVLRMESAHARALQAADQALASWPSDRRLLERAVAIALAQRELGRAQKWGERLVALAPGDDAILRQQVDIDLAAGDTHAALGALLALVERHPQDAPLRARVAEVATWSAEPRVALSAWAWLAARGTPGAREKALDLGRALYDYKTVIALLDAGTRQRELKLSELLDLADAFESEGNPEAARVAMRRFETVFARDPEYWRERAALDEHVGDLDGALVSVREVNRRFAGSVEPAREPELLWSLDRPAEALEAARRQAPTAAASDASFWRLYGDLAWTMDADVDAEAAYRAMWQTGAADAEVAERLGTLLAARGDVDYLGRVASDAFQRFAATGVLLTAMDAAIEAQHWRTARDLASVASANPGDLVDEPGYWAALGLMAAHDGRPAESAAAFAKAVALAPSDGALAEDLRDARLEAGIEKQPDDSEEARDGARDAASARLEAAIDKHDRKAVRAVLASDGPLLSLAERIDAERELGRDQRAWELLAQAPARSTDPDEDASIALHRRELSEERTSGGSVSAGIEDLSTLGIIAESGRVDVRRGGYSIDAVAEHDRLDSATGPVIGPVHADEIKAGLGLALQEPIGDTRVEAGGYGFASGAVPYATAIQRFEPLTGLTIDLEGLYHARPTETPALRATALKDTAELEIGWRFADRYLVAAAAGATHYADREGDYLANGAVGRFEISRLMRATSPLIRLRADGFLEANRATAILPASVATVVPVGTATDDVVPDTYGTAGMGLTILGLSDDEEDMATGRAPLGCHRCLRPFADLWAGWLMPAERITYSLDAGLGYLFARHQELAATGFYRSDQGGQAGQRYMGLSLLYGLRWM